MDKNHICVKKVVIKNGSLKMTFLEKRGNSKYYTLVECHFFVMAIKKHIKNVLYVKYVVNQLLILQKYVKVYILEKKLYVYNVSWLSFIETFYYMNTVRIVRRTHIFKVYQKHILGNVHVMYIS